MNETSKAIRCLKKENTELKATLDFYEDTMEQMEQLIEVLRNQLDDEKQFRYSVIKILENPHDYTITPTELPF